jgi:uncharacterized protein YegL
MRNNVTEIIFLLDRSGSMKGLEKNTIEGFNKFLSEQVKLDGEVIITTVLFDDRYEILWNGKSAKNVKLTHDDYYVRGKTALLDAVGKTIIDVGHRLSKTEEAKRPSKVIFVITTDGLENASIEFSYEKIKKLIKHQQQKYSWEFIFLGANIDAAKEASNIGIEDSFQFEASKLGVTQMYMRAFEKVSDMRHHEKK